MNRFSQQTGLSDLPSNYDHIRWTWPAKEERESYSEPLFPQQVTLILAPIMARKAMTKISELQQGITAERLHESIFRLRRSGVEDFYASRCLDMERLNYEITAREKQLENLGVCDELNRPDISAAAKRASDTFVDELDILACLPKNNLDEFIKQMTELDMRLIKYRKKR